MSYLMAAGNRAETCSAKCYLTILSFVLGTLKIFKGFYFALGTVSNLQGAHRDGATCDHHLETRSGLVVSWKGEYRLYLWQTSPPNQISVTQTSTFKTLQTNSCSPDRNISNHIYNNTVRFRLHKSPRRKNFK